MRHPRLLCAALVAIPLVASTGCSSSDDDFASEFIGEAPSAQAAAPAEPMTREDVERLCADHVVVVINRKNKVWLNNRDSSAEELPSALAKLGRAHPRRPVILMMQRGTKAEAATFVRQNAAKAGLGPVEVR